MSYQLILGILLGIGSVAGLALLVPEAETITTGLCYIEINGTLKSSCNEIHDTLNLNSTRQLGFAYDSKTDTFGFNVMTNSTKFAWSVVDDIVPIVWTAQPSAATELLGLAQHQIKLDLSGYKQVRLNAIVTTIGLSNANLAVQYSSDCASWANIAAVNPSITIDATGLKISAWQTLAPNAKGDVCLRIIGSGGNGILSPAFNSLNVQFR